jgi:hypothetical protein
VGPEWIHPEAHLVVEEQIDFFWKQMPVIHGVSVDNYGSVRESVSIR